MLRRRLDEIDLRAEAANLSLDRLLPAGGHLDSIRGQLAAGNVRCCGNNTGNEKDDQLWGETICLTDGTQSPRPAPTRATPEVQYFQLGTSGSGRWSTTSPIQPGRGNWVLHEDADDQLPHGHNNDLWVCLPDGADDDLLSDGCIRIATLNDLTAEWTGGMFDATGKHFYVSVQHNVTGYGVIARHHRLEVAGPGPT